MYQSWCRRICTLLALKVLLVKEVEAKVVVQHQVCLWSEDVSCQSRIVHLLLQVIISRGVHKRTDTANDSGRQK